ncbi:MFS transporter [Stackebrandtia nassauensis]|uniref:Major facilitator superfamily MFS_1 n=1 Tax=Stackebrandtia nassauensis (strain DSM 44728 / CIP 108903 / NRRL B-16338 / NBRC 102104 / LLR-40K-21) TaxID=446470 RepID=D3Q1S9_STANL|nr:MFS transporter [Stackebrandtia nassauensis]ADD39927.1 major facilitator superfamily MFS_1 [Stackebrandtia nassauensis DSM 44728]
MTTETPSTESPRVAPHPWRWRILGFLGIAQLMLILDVTVVAIALPHIETDLDLSREALTWTVSAYPLAFGGLMLLGGRLADLWGAKRIVLAGLLTFTAASLVTGLATDGAVLLGGRVAQGVGAAMLSPAALSLVVTLFDGRERDKALGVWSALGGGGAALGVLVGGLLTTGPGWSWVFYVNVPVGAVIIVVLAKLLPRTGSAAVRGRLDILGALLVTASSGAVIYALISAGEAGWLTVANGVLALLAIAGYTAFVWWQKRSHSPLMDVRLLARRPVATGTFLILVATALMIAVFFLGTFYFQRARDYSALHTGLLFLPIAVATMLGANLTGRALGRFGARTLAIAGLLLAALGLAAPVVVMSPVVVVVGVAIAAAGTGALFVVASATALGQVSPQEAGVASGIVSTFHEFGASVGAAVVSSVAAASLIGDTLSGFTDGFVVIASAAAVAAVIAGFLTPGKQPTGSGAGAHLPAH